MHLAPSWSGMGSGAVAPPYIVTALQGIANAVAANWSLPGLPPTVTYSRTSPLSDAVAAAKAAHVAVVCTATVSSEGADRIDLSLPQVPPVHPLLAWPTCRRRDTLALIHLIPLVLVRVRVLGLLLLLVLVLVNI